MHVDLIRTLGEPHHITKASYCDERAQGLINPPSESYTFNVGLKSHTLQLGPNIPSHFVALTPAQASCALAPLISPGRTLQCRCHHLHRLIAAERHGGRL